MIAIVIPTRNRANNLDVVLRALADQSASWDNYEVIVSDDHSNDGTYNVWDRYAAQPGTHFKYVNNNTKPHSWNASVPRNLGAFIADPQCTAFWFVDSDIVMPHHAVATYMEDLERKPDRVIIGSYDFYRKDNEVIAVPDVRNTKFESVGVDELFSTVHDGLACFGGNIVIPRHIFWDVKGFSVDTHIGLEDGDMGLKLWKRQTNFSYDNRVRGKHLWHETPPDRFPPDMKDHIDKLNMKHFGTKDPDYGIIEASRETYASWGITGWNPPPEWVKMGFGMEVNKV